MSNQVDTQAIEANEARADKWYTWDIVGAIILIISILGLLFFSNQIGGAFDYVFQDVHNNAVVVFLGAGGVAGAVIASVCTGRILERLGVTDALIKLMMPFTKLIKVNPTVILPVIYNVLGDATAAVKITLPTLRRAGCTRQELKIAIATLVNAPTAFSTMMTGMVMLSLAGINSLPVLLVNLIFPIFFVPAICRLWWRDTKYIPLKELPKFTPKGNVFNIFCDSAIEGINLVIMVIIPSVAAIIMIIAFLTYFGVWQYIEIAIGWILTAVNVHPQAGTLGILVSPLVGFPIVNEAIAAGTVAKKVVVGTFLLGNSGCIANLTFTQFPILLRQEADMKTGEALGALLVGWLFKLVTCFLIGFIW